MTYAPYGISLWDLLTYNWFYLFQFAAFNSQVESTSYSTWMGCSFKCVWLRIPPSKDYEELPWGYMILVSMAYFNDYFDCFQQFALLYTNDSPFCENWRRNSFPYSFSSATCCSSKYRRSHIQPIRSRSLADCCTVLSCGKKVTYAI